MSESEFRAFFDALGIYTKTYKLIFHSLRTGKIPERFCHLAALGMVCHLMPGATPAKPEEGIPDSVQEFLNSIILKKENPDDDPR